MREWEEEGRVKEKGNNNNNRQKIRDKEKEGKKENRKTVPTILAAPGFSGDRVHPHLLASTLLCQ